MYKSKVRKKSNRKRSQKQVKTKEDIICSQIKPDIASTEPFEEYHPAEGLFEKENDIEGKDLFKLSNTPKANRKSFIESFEKSLTVSKNATETPEKTVEFKSQSVRSKLKEASRTSCTQKVEDCSTSFKDDTQTPEKTERQIRSMRLRMKQELAGLKTATVESDPEDSESASNDDSYDSDSQEDEIVSTAACELTRRKKDKGPSFSEAYFTAQRQKKAGTSNKTLSNVKLEQTSVQELADILKNIPESHKKEKDSLFKKYCSQFEYWDFLFETGFNILLYGVGSKLNLLKKYCKEHLENELYVVIYGFFPSLTLKQILGTITEDALDYDGKFSNVQDHCDYIKKYFSERNENLYIIIHSIDGIALRSVKTQSVLSSLATVPNIHFICSMDHINAPLLWDQIMMSHFKWVWFDTTTFEPYILETSYESSLLRDQSSHLLLSSLLHVYNSLTPNSRGVFLILAKHQKTEQKKSSNSGITFHEWYQECREAFLVNSELTMQAQLSEFKNHKLLTSHKNSDGVELWYIPVDNATLDQFLESCE